MFCNSFYCYLKMVYYYFLKYDFNFSPAGVNVGSHKIKMARGPELSNAAFDLHMKYLKENYGNQAIVNLLGSSLVGTLQIKKNRVIEFHEFF